MTRREQAQVRKLRKRLDACFAALCIIKTWLSFPDEEHTLYHIGKLVTERIEEERAAMAREGETK